jgi:hypothetical protein
MRNMVFSAAAVLIVASRAQCFRPRVRSKAQWHLSQQNPSISQLTLPPEISILVTEERTTPNSDRQPDCSAIF